MRHPAALRAPATAEMMITSYLLTLAIAVPVGIISAVKQYSAVDYTFTALSFLFYAAPTFFVGTVLILVFSVHLGWFGPEGPQGGVLSDLTDWHDQRQQQGPRTRTQAERGDHQQKRCATPWMKPRGDAGAGGDRPDQAP